MLETLTALRKSLLSHGDVPPLLREQHLQLLTSLMEEQLFSIETLLSKHQLDQQEETNLQRERKSLVNQYIQTQRILFQLSMSQIDYKTKKGQLFVHSHLTQTQALIDCWVDLLFENNKMYQ